MPAIMCPIPRNMKGKKSGSEETSTFTTRRRACRFSAIGQRMPRVEEKVDGISYYICGRRRDYSSSGTRGLSRRGRAGGREVERGGGREKRREASRAADSLLEGNTYYRFWDETGGYPGSNHDKCIDIHRRARTPAVPVCASPKRSRDRTPEKLFPISNSRHPVAGSARWWPP